MLAKAIEHLEHPYDLIACSVHFNHEQFYDFLRLAKAHPIARDTPFFVHFTGMENRLHYISQSVEIASKAMGAAEVMPIYQWRNEFGNEAAFEKYRAIIHKYVGR